VSHLAIDLIASLLTEKEHRISCRRYRDNDQYIRGRYSGVRRPTTRFPSISPYFVVADDAEDIKAHTFFRGIAWDEMEFSRPPWIPTIKRDQSLAKWFEDEAEIMGTSEERGSSVDVVSEMEDPMSNGVAIKSDIMISGSNGVLLPPIHEVKGATNGHNTADIVGEGIATPLSPTITTIRKKQTKVQKRPRCKILRDPTTGPIALAERKAKAFLGYTYRRPEIFALGHAEERVGRTVARPSVYGIIGTVEMV
jgi:protein-serine/threonine kinase